MRIELIFVKKISTEYVKEVVKTNLKISIRNH